MLFTFVKPAAIMPRIHNKRAVSEAQIRLYFPYFFNG
ncbi:hypothetical protein L585_18400 [Pantoea ananatis BRT175]|nr:hypothetical protein L585_18400 [Pantoea ananatis BRT175]